VLEACSLPKSLDKALKSKQFSLLDDLDLADTFTFVSSVSSSFIPQRLELLALAIDMDGCGDFIESFINITFTNECTGMPASIGFYRLVGNSLLFVFWRFFISLALVTHY
jgi:hypothetical protein